jgi:CRISPR-associated protein Csm4
MSAYQTFRLWVKLRHSAITPWQSDTLFGSFCWAYAYLHGEPALEAMLTEYTQGTPRVVISSGFPDALLPKPLFGLAPAEAPAMEKQAILDTVREEKRRKKIAYLTINEFRQFQMGQAVEIAAKVNPLVMGVSFHNQIDRNLGTTGESGALYSQTEWFSGECLSVYLKIKFGFETETLEVFKVLGQIGVGKKRYFGKGSFTVEDFSVCNDFDDVRDPNAFISLSNFVPAGSDPTEGRYQTMVKYGKTEFGSTSNPFKKPLIMIVPGAVFKLNGEFKPFYGRMIRGISTYSSVYHYGLAFAVPVKLDWKS